MPADRDDLAVLLIGRGADVNARDDSELTPLHYAANYAPQQGYTVVVELLLRNGADVNAEAKDGRTPLNLVLFNDEMKTLLKRHGGHVATVGR